MTKSQIDVTIDLIEAAAGSYRVTGSNPCGLAAYYDEGEEKPWRISDDQASESFATPQEAMEGARAWAEAME